ncbi:MAG TPA: SGNH/GDSL hydrolase family protein [Anaerolineales bacterium]|nr:SGNH/GDSL hydrolase family protein [Anaerolineales bacterium]
MSVFVCEYNHAMRRRVLLIAAFVLSACSSPAMPPSTSETSAMPLIRYLALGDSYTIGESVAEPDRWSNQLADLLAAKLERRVEVTLIARTGWTVDELWQGIQTSNIEPPYDLVSLLIGVNDQYRGYPVEGYREDFRFMLGKAIEFAGGDPKRVVVLSIPDWGVMPFAAGRNRERIAQEIDAFNAVNREETEKAGARYVDITSISRDAIADPSLIAEDGLHPSGKMYALWAEKVLRVALKILSEEKGE